MSASPPDPDMPRMSAPVPPGLDPIALARRRAAFPIVISGPSGVGKTVIVQHLLAQDPTLTNSVSATTRPIRPGEQDGVHYHFYPEPRFQELIQANGFLEWARVHDHFYGTPTAPLEANLARGTGVVLNIDVQGGKNLRAARPDTLLIFIVPPSLPELEKRLRSRGTDSPADIERRLANARGELAEAVNYDYLVVNDSVERAGREILTLVEAERRRFRRLADAPA